MYSEHLDERVYTRILTRRVDAHLHIKHGPSNEYYPIMKWRVVSVNINNTIRLTRDYFWNRCYYI